MREDKLSVQSMDFAVNIINLVKELKFKKEKGTLWYLKYLWDDFNIYLFIS